MPQVIAPQTAAAAAEFIPTQIGQCGSIHVDGPIGAAEVIPVMQPNSDGTWRQFSTEAEGDIELSAENRAIVIPLPIGKIRVEKPITASAVGVRWEY